MTLVAEKMNLSSTQDFRFRNVEALIIKVTKRCNLSCTYCYESITKSGDMDINTFKNLAERAFLNSEKKKIQFIFHGGEPTLLPDEFYIEAFAFCKKLAESTGKKLSLSIQTNLIHLTKEKMELFKENKVTIGASLDGPAELVGSMRPSAHKAISNFFRARENGLKVGVLMTINQSNFNKFDLITDWLYNVMGVTDFKSNVVYSVGSGYEVPDMKPEQVFEAQKNVLDYMIKSKGKKVVEHNLMWQIDWFSRENDHHKESLCHAQKCGAGTKVIGITPDGNLLPCGRFQWNNAEYFLGSLTDVSEIEEFEQKVDTFHSLHSENWFNCNDCSAKKICASGCQAFISRSKSRANVECLPTKMLYDYFLEKEDDIAALHKVFIDKKSILLDEYDDKKYGDSSGPPYSDVYQDKYNDS